jgi:FdhD protein
VVDHARRSVPVRRSGAGAAETTDWVAVEEPLQLRVGFDDGDTGSHDLLVTMRTPGHDAELARGLLYSEGLVDAAADIVDLVTAPADPNVLVLTLRAVLRERLPDRQRSFYASAACGVCGTASVGFLGLAPNVREAVPSIQVAASRLAALPAALLERQPAFSSTGGLHAAALFAVDGAIRAVREDVGRHNAVDKLTGAALAAGELPLADSGLFVSGRVSFEIIAKAHRAGLALVCSVGAPTSLAVDAAWECGITLVGFLRDGRFNIYSVPTRVDTAS